MGEHDEEQPSKGLDFFEIVELVPPKLVLPVLLLASLANTLTFVIQRKVAEYGVIFSPIIQLEFYRAMADNPPVWIFVVDAMLLMILYLTASSLLYLVLDLKFQRTTFTYALNFLVLVAGIQFVGALFGGLLALLFNTLIMYNIFTVLSLVISLIVVHFGMDYKTRRHPVVNILLFVLIFLLSYLVLWLFVRVVSLIA